MAHIRQKLLTACSDGDISVIETSFQELGIGSDHPHYPYGFDKNIPEEQHPPAVVQMLEAAIMGEQVETISFLFAKFPGFSCFGSPMAAAINTGNADVLRIVCKFDPASADAEVGDDATVNALGYACSKKNAAELVKVLLEAGADPNNVPPFRLPGTWNVSAAVLGGLPVETFEQFFDAGYSGNDTYAVRLAVEKNRPDILRVLFSRGKDLPYAEFPLKEDLIKAASERNDSKMVSLIESEYPIRSKKEKGFIGSLVNKFRTRK